MKTNAQTFQECIDKFDFEKAAEFYRRLDWHWHFGAETEIPTAEEIRSRVKELYLTMVFTDSDFVTSGGMAVVRTADCFLIHFAPVDSFATKGVMR